MLAHIPSAHTEVVTSLSFSPHGRTAPSHDLLLCSTSGDDTAALWDGRLLVSGTGTHPATTDHAVSSAHDTSALAGRVMVLAHHRGPVNHALFAPHDANLLLTCADDRTVAMWDLRKPDNVVATLRGFSEGVNKMLWLPADMYPALTRGGCGGADEATTAVAPLLASACDDGLVYIHILVQGTESSTAAPPTMGTLLDKFFVSTSTVNDMVLLPRARGSPAASRVLATASEDGAVRTWRLPFNTAATTDERLLASLDAFSNPVNHLALVPSPSVWRAAVTEASPQTPQPRTGACDAEEGDTAKDGASAASHAHVAPDESEEDGADCWLLAACSEDVFGVDVNVGSGLFGAGALEFRGHTDYVRGLKFVPSQGATTPLLVTVADDGTAVEWRLRNPLPTPQHTPSPRTAPAATSNAGARIRVAHRYGDGDEAEAGEGATMGGVHGAAASTNEEAEDAERGENDGEDDGSPGDVQAGGEPIFQAQLHDGLIMASAVAPIDRTILATGTDTGAIKLWRVPLSASTVPAP